MRVDDVAGNGPGSYRSLAASWDAIDLKTRGFKTLVDDVAG